MNISRVVDNRCRLAERNRGNIPSAESGSVHRQGQARVVGSPDAAVEGIDFVVGILPFEVTPHYDRRSLVELTHGYGLRSVEAALSAEVYHSKAPEWFI